MATDSTSHAPGATTLADDALSGRKRPARRSRQAFEPGVPFVYPQQLKDAIADLPGAPGVYIFHGQEGDLPLYIGKSIHLRNRVLSHLRAADEARMLR